MAFQLIFLIAQTFPQSRNVKHRRLCGGNPRGQGERPYQAASFHTYGKVPEVRYCSCEMLAKVRTWPAVWLW